MLWPNGTTVKPRVSSPFGPRNSKTPGASKNHKGTDFTGFTHVKAIADGTVTVVGTPVGWAGGGIQVWIQHDGFLTRSLHMKTGSPTVKVGQKVREGQTLGLMGMTGTASGVHLHLEVVVSGVQIDPETFIANRAPSGGGSGAVMITDEDAQKIAQHVWEYESKVNKLKFGDMLRVVYNSIRYGQTGVRHHGEFVADNIKRNTAIQTQLAQILDALGKTDQIDVEAFAEAVAGTLQAVDAERLAKAILKAQGQALTEWSE